MKDFYNPTTSEKFSEAKIINGKPSGIINFNDTSHQWAVSIFKLMESYTWFVGECHLSQDKTKYKALSDEKQYAYDMVLGQLIANDSIQVSQLMNSISNYITSPVVASCLARQAYEEANHSRTYSVAADEICEDSQRIYELHTHEPALLRKNNAVRNMYKQVNVSGEYPTDNELLIAFAANQILEELVFPSGFVTIWSLNLPGTNKAISFIERDESGTHVPLFKNIFRTAVKETGLDNETKGKIELMIDMMVSEEKAWIQHITKGLLGFSENAINMFIEYKANSICRNLYLDNLYEITDGGPLKSIEDKYSMLSTVKTKTNFFEGSVGDYSVGTLDEDY